jgi:hypothetical protein
MRWALSRLCAISRIKSGIDWHEMADSADKLTPKQEAAILALLTARSVEEAAK